MPLSTVTIQASPYIVVFTIHTMAHPGLRGMQTACIQMQPRIGALCGSIEKYEGLSRLHELRNL
eukprot:1151204-Pelagomonas_calceolata.AAC.2